MESTDTGSERIQTPGDVINSLSMKIARLLIVKKEQEEDVKVVRQGWRAKCWDSNLFECWRTEARKKMKERTDENMIKKGQLRGKGSIKGTGWKHWKYWASKYVQVRNLRYGQSCLRQQKKGKGGQDTNVPHKHGLERFQNPPASYSILSAALRRVTSHL